MWVLVCGAGGVVGGVGCFVFGVWCQLCGVWILVSSVCVCVCVCVCGVWCETTVGRDARGGARGRVRRLWVGGCRPNS